ncbi:MAG: DUF2490 domain-containing protein [Pyrinomonadaceae bacterium]
MKQRHFWKIPGVKAFPTILVLLLCLHYLVSAVSPQPAFDDDDVQSWNDVPLTVPIHDRVDLVLTGTVRFGDSVRRLVDRRAAVAVSFKVLDRLSIQPGYTNIATTVRPNIRRRIEHRLNLAATYKFPFKKFALSNRSLIERRVREPRKSTRYRNRLQFELPIKVIDGTKLIISDEVFYDWSLDRWSRNRFTVGINHSINRKLSLDVYYMRQNDGTTRPGDLHIIRTNWKIKL